MIDLRFRPLDKPIPTPTGGRLADRFAIGWSKLLDELEVELKHIRATDVFVEAALRPDQIRMDGWPKGGASPTTPGVRLHCQSKHGPLVYECGTFRTMEQNLRAIGMTLNRLRMVEEYGATKSGQQYRGWSALPPGGPIQAGAFATVEDAARHLCTVAGPMPGLGLSADLIRLVLDDAEAFNTVYRVAARKAHPDTGGTTAAMAKVNAAEEMIEADQRRRGVA